MKDPFNELSKQLKNATEHAEDITDTKKVLTPAFIKAHTKFNNATDWLISGELDFDTITDDFVKQSTDFDSWKDMYETAASEYLHSLFGGIK